LNIIAEVGINHNGDIGIAKQLIDMAKDCGCDAVKFQKRTIDLAYSQEFLDLPRESPWGTTQREQKEGLEFGAREYDEIDSYCRKLKIDWFASAWDLEALKFLQQYRPKHNKIASKMTGDLGFVQAVAELGIHTYVSTGLDEHHTRWAAEIFKASGCPFTLLHCTMKYPCPDEETRLGKMDKLRYWGVPIGFSSHNPSILAPAIAVALGAEVIEAHITLDRTMYGSDQPASFEAEGLRRIVRDCHRVRSML